MAKDAAITVRLPADLKDRLTKRARHEHRSLSAQVQVELERAVAREPEEAAELEPALGMFGKARLPSEDDLKQVRAALWGSLARRDA